MRQARLKSDPDRVEAVYHCISRTVNGQFVLDRVALEVLRGQLGVVAEFSGVQVITYALLNNHFHLLVRVPIRTRPADAELLRRYRLLYPRRTKYRTADPHDIERLLREDGAGAQRWRESMYRRMGDVSAFMKTLKERYTRWFNHTHRRFGTLWAERFKSTLVQPVGHASQTMAAYLDLNAVRANLTKDPKDYRFCGYAEAVAGGRRARTGLGSLFPGEDWKAVQSSYREILYASGAAAREHGRAIPIEEYRRVRREKGQLTLAEALHCRIRHFSDGAVLGSRAFVTEQLEEYRRKTGRRQRTAPRPLPPVAAWGDLMTLRGLRRRG